ncbi:MAG TPA: Rv2231c family pyridoxal phosphate-dependent protein CobC [Gaiellaceae bacterium]|nr:Rv2231c family pyridoxal phosphate-dependent protein CobC [Gaiellaceae bacterium]
MSLRLHGDALAEPGLLDFAVNTWPGPRSPQLEAALRRALASTAYPSEREARARIAARHGVEPAAVLAANGACEVFWLIAHALRPRRACCIHPAFTEPEAALRAVGADVRHVFREPGAWRFDPASVPEDAELVVVGNPNNPTGGLDARAHLLALLRPGRLVLVDESFMDFVPGEPESLAGTRRPGLAVLRSLTKLWALAGLRAGYLLAEPDLVKRLEANRQPWSVNALACAALATCADDRETPARVAAEVTAEREGLVGALAGLPGVRVWPGAANFLLLRLADGPAAVARLREEGIAVRPAWTFPGLDERFVRVAVRRGEDNRRLVEALARC